MNEKMQCNNEADSDVTLGSIPAEEYPFESANVDNAMEHIWRNSTALSNSMMKVKKHYSLSSRNSLMMRLIDYLLLICTRYNIRLITKGGI